MTLDDLSTPCLLVERRRLESNLDAMQQKAEANEVALRPHIKTHKTVRIAEMQRDRGARGITVAKPGEAEVFVEAGFDDVRLAYPVVGREKHERLLALTDRTRVSFCVDTVEGAEAASAVYEEAGQPADVLMEIDTGHGRTGVPWDEERETIELARHVESLPGLTLVGLLTHAGQGYHGPQEKGETPKDALHRAAEEERDRILEVAVRLHEAGVDAAQPDRLEISIGSTPTMSAFENQERGGFRITEVRPGNYVFYDAIQVDLGSAELTDCALTAWTTIASKRRERSGRERLYLDAGKKVLTSDTGYDTDGHGVLLYNAAAMRALPHARLTSLSEEHGWVTVPGGSVLAVGDRVRVVPNHACVTVNTQDHLYLVDGQDVVDTLPVDARGHSA